MQSPIILVGTHRSGTSWLTRVFSQHPDLACWMEPRYVWSWGNNYKPNDVLDIVDATPKVRAHIRQRFERFVKDQGKTRLFEKTPSNCLRLPFINQVLPEAKIIHIVRDGRSVFSSASDMLESGFYRPDKLKSRFSEMLKETPIVEWPAHLPRIQETLTSKITKTPLQYWGPRPSGWQNWLGEHPQAVILAKQWVATIDKALMDGAQLPKAQYHRFRYEDLINNPSDTMNALIDFLELPKSQSLLEKVQETADPTRQRQWNEVIDEETLHQIRPHMEEMLNKLGYQW